jgi:tetratricopeptide (TPR) repeat protein
MDRSPLQHERVRRGWTQEHVADQLRRLGVEHGHGNLGIDANAVSRHERGIVVMLRDPYPILYAALYGTTVDALWPAMIEGVERRGFLRALAAAPVASMLPAGLDVTTQAGTAAQAGEVIAYLRRIFPEFSTADWLLGCQAVLPVMPRHLATVEQLLPGVTGRNRTELLKVGARYGEFCSWLHQDAGDIRAASLWADRAIEWATEADDRAMVAYTLARKAHQAAESGDAARTVGLAQAAGRHAATPRLRTAAMLQEAHGHALAGDERASLGMLDQAAETAGRADGEPGPGRYLTPQYVEIQRAACWLILGRHERTVPTLERELARLPAVHRRDRGVYLARLASAYAASGEREQATAAAGQALQVAHATGSRRILRELRPARPR